MLKFDVYMGISTCNKIMLLETNQEEEEKGHPHPLMDVVFKVLFAAAMKESEKTSQPDTSLKKPDSFMQVLRGSSSQLPITEVHSTSVTMMAQNVLLSALAPGRLIMNAPRLVFNHDDSSEEEGEELYCFCEDYEDPIISSQEFVKYFPDDDDDSETDSEEENSDEEPELGASFRGYEWFEEDEKEEEEVEEDKVSIKDSTKFAFLRSSRLAIKSNAQQVPSSSRASGKEDLKEDRDPIINVPMATKIDGMVVQYFPQSFEREQAPSTVSISSKKVPKKQSVMDSSDKEIPAETLSSSKSSTKLQIDGGSREHGQNIRSTVSPSEQRPAASFTQYPEKKFIKRDHKRNRKPKSREETVLKTDSRHTPVTPTEELKQNISDRLGRILSGPVLPTPLPDHSTSNYNSSTPKSSKRKKKKISPSHSPTGGRKAADLTKDWNQVFYLKRNRPGLSNGAPVLQNVQAKKEQTETTRDLQMYAAVQMIQKQTKEYVQPTEDKYEDGAFSSKRKQNKKKLAEKDNVSQVAGTSTDQKPKEERQSSSLQSVSQQSFSLQSVSQQSLATTVTSLPLPKQETRDLREPQYDKPTTSEAQAQKQSDGRTVVPRHGIEDEFYLKKKQQNVAQISAPETERRSRKRESWQNDVKRNQEVASTPKRAGPEDEFYLKRNKNDDKVRDSTSRKPRDTKDESDDSGTQ